MPVIKQANKLLVIMLADPVFNCVALPAAAWVGYQLVNGFFKLTQWCVLIDIGMGCLFHLTPQLECFG